MFISESEFKLMFERYVSRLRHADSLSVLCMWHDVLDGMLDCVALDYSYRDDMYELMQNIFHEREREFL